MAIKFRVIANTSTLSPFTHVLGKLKQPCFPVNPSQRGTHKLVQLQGGVQQVARATNVHSA